MEVSPLEFVLVLEVIQVKLRKEGKSNYYKVIDYEQHVAKEYLYILCIILIEGDYRGVSWYQQ